jgi:hypothetical protein
LYQNSENLGQENNNNNKKLKKKSGENFEGEGQRG